MSGATTPRRRATDKGLLCLVALRFSQLWDFIDARDIDKHLVAAVLMWQTYHVTWWAFAFAEKVATRPGLEVAAVIAAVLGPWSLLVGAAVKFYFSARTET